MSPNGAGFEAGSDNGQAAATVPLSSYRDRYRDGSSVRSAIDAVLAQLAALDDPAVVIGDPLVAQARERADALDQMPASSAAELPLFGIPFVVKDNIDVAGASTTAACPSFGYLAQRDAVAVARLRAAGAIPVAKVNLDQFATGLVGTRSPYGTPRNPVHPTLVPGGSSSGSAVAVARGLVPFALGTDTAGSGRVPAALCELVGVKPTPGRVPNTGSVPAVRRIDCITVFASNVADARSVAAVMAGPDPGDPWSSEPGPLAAPVRRLGIPSGLAAYCDEPVAVAFAAYVASLAETQPALELVEVDIAGLLEVGSWLYGGPFTAERAVAVGAFLAAGPTDADPVVASIITGSMAATATDAYAAEYRLVAARREHAALWNDVDALLLPTIPGVTTPEQVAADPIGANSALGRFTTFTNLLGLAAVALPGPRRADGMPNGVQLIGPAWSDEPLADLAMGLLGENHASWPPTPVGPGEQSLVVVGAHLSGMALNHQLTRRGARLLAATTTAAAYRLFALPGTTPPKPGLQRVAEGGSAIAVEVWALGEAAFGSFVAEVPPPLAIGSVELADGSWHNGFVCEPYALEDAPEVTRFGGWRAYLEQR